MTAVLAALLCFLSCSKTIFVVDDAANNSYATVIVRSNNSPDQSGSLTLFAKESSYQSGFGRQLVKLSRWGGDGRLSLFDSNILFAGMSSDMPGVSSIGFLLNLDDPPVAEFLLWPDETPNDLRNQDTLWSSDLDSSSIFLGTVLHNEKHFHLRRSGDGLESHVIIMGARNVAAEQSDAYRVRLAINWVNDKRRSRVMLIFPSDASGFIEAVYEGEATEGN